MKADIVVFNPDTVTNTSTFAKPDTYSTGIDWVLINGQAVVANAKPTNALPGKVLRGPAYKP
jgi:N-acyl-D-aspartate/D-glutamate deacylase